ncbi:MAG: hypothetical protein DDT33_01364 [Firmicutes bacterium]|nr:hypothetical protein [Bacillota bacterium]
MEQKIKKKESDTNLEWIEIRAAKIMFCHHCLKFDRMLGGCKLKLMATDNCNRFTKKPLNDYSRLYLSGLYLIRNH